MRNLHFGWVSGMAAVLACGASAACSSSSSGGAAGTGGKSGTDGAAASTGGANVGGATGTGGAAGASGATGTGGTAGASGAAGAAGSGGVAATGGSTGAGGGGGVGGAAVACSGSTPVALTVKNFESWCSVKVGAGTAATAPTQTVCVAAGDVAVSATALAGFQLGTAPWHGTSGDTGSGDPGTVKGGASSAQIVAKGTSTCAWVCCEFTAGGGCPTTDQCP